MDHNYIDQSGLVDRYLIGKLSSEESARFEEHFVDCPQCVDRLKTTGNFVQGLRHASLQQSLEAGSYRREERPFYLSWMNAYKPAALAAGLALAVVMAGAVLAVNYIQSLQAEIDRARSDSARWQRSYEEEREAASLSREKSQETEQVLTGQIRGLEVKLQDMQEQQSDLPAGPGPWVKPGVNVQIFPLTPSRGGEPGSSETGNEVALPRAPVGFVISLGLEGEAKYKNYRITILNDRDRPVFKEDGSIPDRHNSLSIGFNSTFFRPGNYLIVVEGLTHDGGTSPVGNYPFRVTKK